MARPFLLLFQMVVVDTMWVFEEVSSEVSSVFIVVVVVVEKKGKGIFHQQQTTITTKRKETHGWDSVSQIVVE